VKFDQNSSIPPNNYTQNITMPPEAGYFQVRNEREREREREKETRERESGRERERERARERDKEKEKERERERERSGNCVFVCLYVLNSFKLVFFS